MRALKNYKKVAVVFSLIAFSNTALVGCGGDESKSSSTEDNVPVAYVKRSDSTLGNPTDSVMFARGGDLYMRDRSSPSAPERNITGSLTGGQGDVSDPEVSYDGTKILFSMRRPGDGHWSIWEHDTRTRATRQILCDARDLSTNLRIPGDDVDPAYLPDGGIVFTSNRQVGTWRGMQSRGETPYKFLDEYEREPVTVLHVMDSDGRNCQQISFNQSHDRNPTVLRNGKIMFSRWDHVGDRNHFVVFQVNPDGSDMFVLYGAHSPGNSFLHPREMQDGRVMSSLMPLSGTDEGGALMLVDVQNYTENDTPMRRGMPNSGGQRQATRETITLGEELSLGGRITTPYPLWDGTPRALVAFSPCQARRNGQVVACSVLSASERNRLQDRTRLLDAIQNDTVQNDVPAAYSIHMFDYSRQELRLVVPAQPGVAITDPVALMPRPIPNPISRQMPTGTTGTVEVLSVYDTDHLGRMGPAGPGQSSLLLPTELAGLPLIVPADPDTRVWGVVDLNAVKNPQNSAYLNRVARFIRVTTPVPPPSGSQGLRQAIGETEFEMQRILGYAEVEPDGSFILTLPADMPFAFAVLDQHGRAIQTHTNWMQLRPGERLTCKGCHTPRPNFAPIADRARGTHSGPQWLMPVDPITQATETMAQTRARVSGGTSLNLGLNISFTDIWANAAEPGVTATPAVSFNYTGGAGVPVVPVNGTINYPDHIQPMWERSRTCADGISNCACVACHTDSTRLSLLATTSATGRMLSYEELLVGDPLLDGSNQPVIQIVNGVPQVRRGPTLVSNTAGEGEAGGIARKSRLTEILFGQSLRASSESRTRFPAPAMDHTTLLNSAEMRLLTEWMDLGGQYYNTPFSTGGIVRTISGVDEDDFAATGGPHSILMARCATCHQPAGSGTPSAPSFERNRFVLTGSAMGDFNAVLALINDACTPGNSLLLSQPSVLHPSTSATPSVVLPAADPDYTTIAQWILDGC